jgi:hypothetical protein
LHSDVSQYFVSVATWQQIEFCDRFVHPLPYICNDSRWQRDFRVLIRFYSASSFNNGGNWVIRQMWDMILLAGRNASEDSKEPIYIEEVFSCTSTLVRSNFTLIGGKETNSLWNKS